MPSIVGGEVRGHSQSITSMLIYNFPLSQETWGKP